ncbi:sensor histidine kinase [Herpetosiphon llansteffanensis]|uniref:sensor histidine kinase n=1 Tax=Herpetosiphon llansteffanensis TaxID=2094568 RepID=UPI0013E0B499|nr:ATP-binding protein [Herpetosiphon llansteffanensis]
MNITSREWAMIEDFSRRITTEAPQSLVALAEALSAAFQVEVTIWSRTAAGEYHCVTPAVGQPDDQMMSAEQALNGEKATLIFIYEAFYAVKFNPAHKFSPAQVMIIQALLEGWIGRLRTSYVEPHEHENFGDLHQSLLQSIIDVLPEGVVVGLAPDGRLILANRQAEQLWQHPLHAVPVAGYNHFGLHKPDGTRLPAGDSGIARVIKTGEPFLKHELILRRPDGSEIPILANTSPIHDNRGNLIGAVAVFQDITGWKLQESDRDNAIATIVHDLKNPLTTIRGSADLLLRRAKTENRSERELNRLQSIIAQSDRMRDYLSLLVDVARINAGETLIAPSLLDFGDLVAQLVTTINGGLANPRIAMELHAAPKLRVDPIWMERVIWNLLDNALKYSADETVVVVKLALEAQTVVLSIRDSGLGIDPQDLERIFERFTRGRHTQRVGGTGLGLYTVRAVVRAHGGSIKVESEGLGHGSCFTVSLPLESIEP